jgi:hypothetical protein
MLAGRRYFTRCLNNWFWSLELDCIEKFGQVDVNVCESKEEWDRRIFHHGYGDLNMIMGLIAKNAGLHYSDKGLKVCSTVSTQSPLLLNQY